MRLSRNFHLPMEINLPRIVEKLPLAGRFLVCSDSKANEINVEIIRELPENYYQLREEKRILDCREIIQGVRHLENFDLSAGRRRENLSHGGNFSDIS